MTNRLLILGFGYTASRLKARLDDGDWTVIGTGRTARDGVLAFHDEAAVHQEIDRATHILSSVPPAEDGDPVLSVYGNAIAAARCWTGYLSSTGVYGDCGGAWVDETAPIGSGRRTSRSAADADWRQLSARTHVFRLPGIYGPGRSPFQKLREGTASRIDAPGQVFSRIHVDDICTAVIAAMRRPKPGIYNIADDQPAPAHEVTAFAAHLLGIKPPPLIPLENAQLSPMARGFYAENRRVANGKMTRDLGIRLRYPDYRSGLSATLSEETSP